MCKNTVGALYSIKFLTEPVDSHEGFLKYDRSAGMQESFLTKMKNVNKFRHSLKSHFTNINNATLNEDPQKKNSK